MKQIPLTRGQFATVDDDDYAGLAAYTWHAKRSSSGKFYASRNTPRPRRRMIYMHREILGLLPGDTNEVDHRNGDSLLNTRKNLRIATPQQNQRASRIKKRGYSSNFRGVCWHRVNKNWVAFIHVFSNKKFLGAFMTEEEAARAYDAAATTMFGDFASLNFPPC